MSKRIGDIAFVTAATLALGLALFFGQASAQFYTPNYLIKRSSTSVPTAVNLGTASILSGATLVLSSVTVPAGSAIVVCTNENNILNPTGGTVADSVGNTYATDGLLGGNNTLTLYSLAFNVAAITGGTITYSKNTTSRQAALSAFYVTGVKTASTPFDSAAYVTVTTASANPPVMSLTSGTPAVAGEMMVACAGGQMSTSGMAFTQDTAHGWATPPNTIFSEQSNSGSQIAGGSLYNAGSGTKIFAPTWSAGAAARQRNGLIIGLKPP